jgi:hypothetical protein
MRTLSEASADGKDCLVSSLMTMSDVVEHIWLVLVELGLDGVVRILTIGSYETL